MWSLQSPSQPGANDFLLFVFLLDLLIDLFVEFPDRYRVLQIIWFLRPNAILMNAGFSNYRLIRLADRFLLNYQAAPVVYLVIIIAALLVGRQKYRRLQIGK